MALLYKGFAQQKGFGANLVKVPDPSERIRQEGLRTLQGMQDQLDWNNAQATRVINALEKNAQIEAKNRRENFELRQSFSQTIQDQKHRNLAVRHQSALTRQRRAEQNIKALLSLTKTGTALYKQHVAKRKEDADIWQHQLYNEHGIGWVKMQALKSATDEVWQDAAQRELLLQKLGLEGVPDDVIDRVRNVSGYRSIAMGKAHAKRWASDTHLYYAENLNTKVPIAGMEVDLASAQGEQVHTVLQLLDAKRRREAGDSAPSSKMLALSGGYELMDRARSTQLQLKTKEAQKLAIQRQWDDETLFLKDAIGPMEDGIARPGIGIERMIKYYAGGDNSTRESMRSSRHRVVSAINNALKTGEISWEDIRELEDHPMKIGGATKTFSQFFEREWESIRAAGADASRTEQAKAGLDMQQNRIKDTQFTSDMYRLAEENPPPETLAKMLAIANSPTNNYSKAAKFITDVMVRGQNASNDSEALATIQGRIANGQYVTREEVLALKPSPVMDATIMAEVNKNNQFLPTKGDFGTKVQLEATVDSLLKNRIPATVLDDKSDVRLGARIEALKQATNRYKAYKVNMSHEDALDNTQKWIAEKILDKNGLWEPVYNEDSKQREFSGFLSTGEWAKIDVDDNGGMVDLANNGNLILVKPYINREELERKSLALNNNQQQPILDRATFIESALGTSPNNLKALDAEIAQITYYNNKAKETGGPLIQPYPEWYIKSVERTYSKITPRAQRLLDKWGYCDINRAACESGLNPIYFKPSMDKAQELLSDNSDYSNTDKGNSYKMFNVDITTLSLADVIKHQENEKFLLAGRYGLDADTLKESAGLAGILLNEKFTSTVQDKLFESYFKTNATALFEGIFDPKSRLLVESVYNSMTNEKSDDNLSFHDPSRLRPEAYEILYAGGRYA